jgi:hypothetical protein
VNEGEGSAGVWARLLAILFIPSAAECRLLDKQKKETHKKRDEREPHPKMGCWHMPQTAPLSKTPH